MANPFEQFSGDAPGIVAQPEEQPSGKNPFEQFWPDEPAVQTQATQPQAPQPSLYQSVYENPMLGAEQRAVPHPDQYGKPISTDLFINDAGEVSYKDAQGNVVPSDRSKHVFLKGPDGRPAVYARTPETTESPLVGGARVLSLGLGSNAPTTAAAVARTAPAAEASIPSLRTAATAVYENPEILSRTVRPADVSSAFNEIRPQLVNRDPEVIKQLTNELSGLGAGEITVRDLNHASERLGVLAGQTTGPLGNQSATPLAQAATVVKKQIDGLMRTAAPEYATADQNYAAMKAAQTIVGRGDLAQVRARGGDFAEKMSQQATSLLANPKYARGFTPDEITQLQDISQGKLKGEGLLNAAQWLGGKIATVGAIGAGAAGYTHSGPLAGVVSAVGTMAVDPLVQGALARMGNRLASNQVNALSAAIRARSPLGQQLAQNAQDWERAWKELQSTPTTLTLTALARSSRDLSNALRSAGVEVGPAQLMRGAKGDQDQQNVPRPGGQ